MNDTVNQQVLAANDAFYRAFAHADYPAMRALWARTHEIAVQHPGWPELAGHSDVFESWYRILVIGTPPPIRAFDPHVIVNGTTALVTCYEDTGEVRLIATNSFVREAGDWRLLQHQARPLPKK